MTNNAKPVNSFCEKLDSNCSMNYCDENGCQMRTRHPAEPSPIPDHPVPTSVTIEQKLEAIKSINDNKATVDLYLATLDGIQTNPNDLLCTLRFQAKSVTSQVLVPGELHQQFIDKLRAHYQALRDQLIQDAAELMK